MKKVVPENVRKLRFWMVMLIFLLPLGLWGQTGIDTLAFLNIKDIYLRDSSTMEFDVLLKRNSDLWSKLANGTFEFTFDTLQYNFNSDRVEPTVLETGLRLGIVPGGGQLPLGGYDMKAKCFPGRIVLSLIGPNEFNECETVPNDSSIIIAKMQIKSKDGSALPNKVLWKEPYKYYQALAYKTDRDSIVEDYIKIFSPNDNIEISDNKNNIVSYSSEGTGNEGTRLDSFWLTYLGNRRMAMKWKTKSEYFNAGFTVRRAVKLQDDLPDELLDFSYIVATYKPGDRFLPQMIGKGNSRTGWAYDTLYDTVPYRGVTFCYKLFYDQVYPREGRIVDSLLARGCKPVPNAVISFAQANPNPFNYDTKINFTVDDDVYLTITISDLLGREVKRIMDKKYVKIGSYGSMFSNYIEGTDLTYIPLPNAKNMLYNIIFIAYPINDPSIEISRAVYKVTYLR